MWKLRMMYTKFDHPDATVSSDTPNQKWISISRLWIVQSVKPNTICQIAENRVATFSLGFTVCEDPTVAECFRPWL